MNLGMPEAWILRCLVVPQTQVKPAPLSACGAKIDNIFVLPAV